MYCKRDFSCDDENIKKEKMKFCYIKGPTGPKGTQGDINPQGLTGVSVAIRYLTTIQQLKLESLQEVVVPLNEKEPFFNTTYTEDNGIQINESGFYLVSYYLGASPTDSCTVNS